MGNSYISEWATAPETAPGTPPANAAAWVSSGTRHNHIQENTKIEDLVATDIEVTQSEESVLDHQLRVEGLRNSQGEVGIYWTGTGVTTAAGSQVVQTSQSTLIENAMGGVQRTNSTTCAVGGSHSSTQIDVVADTNFAVGAHIAWEHPTTGRLYCRRLQSNPSGSVWTLDEALPQAASDGDVIHGCITHYVSESVLSDSAQSGRQFSMWYKKADLAAHIYELTGCKLQLDSISLPRDGLATLGFTRHSCNFTAPHESPPDPSWTSPPSGVAPTGIGPLHECQIVDYGSTSTNSECVNDLEVSIGLPILRDETQTTTNDGMQGTCKYYLGRGETTATLMVDPDTSFLTDWDSGTYKNFRYSATPESAGQGIAFHMPRAEILQAPIYGVNGEVSKYKLTCKAHRDTSSIGSTELARSPFYLVEF